MRSIILRFSKNPLDGVNNASSSPEATDSQLYNIPEPVDPLRLRSSNNSVMYQSPGGIRTERVSNDSNQYAMYSSIDNEDPNAEDYYSVPSDLRANEYENPDDIRRCDIALHEYNLRR